MGVAGREAGHERGNQDRRRRRRPPQAQQVARARRRHDDPRSGAGAGADLVENRAASARPATSPAACRPTRRPSPPRSARWACRTRRWPNPTGLSPNNTSTAAEVARIAAAASRYPVIARISSDKSSEVRSQRPPAQAAQHQPPGQCQGLGHSPVQDRLHRRSRSLSGNAHERAAARPSKSTLLDEDGSAQRLRGTAAIRKSLAKIAAGLTPHIRLESPYGGQSRFFEAGGSTIDSIRATPFVADHS